MLPAAYLTRASPYKQVYTVGVRDCTLEVTWASVSMGGNVGICVCPVWNAVSSSDLTIAAAFAASSWGTGTSGSFFSSSAASVYSPQSNFCPSTAADAFADGAVSSETFLSVLSSLCLSV